MGAVNPSSRKAAVKVVVFQWPCGTEARHRWPRGDRPRSLAILVVAPVSSMKTSCPGSRSGWPSNQAWRRRATSGRSCSAACAVFFEADAATIEEAPQRPYSHGDAALSQQKLLQLGQRDVQLLLAARHQEVSLGLNPRRSLIATLRQGCRATIRFPIGNPADRAGYPDTKPLRRLPSR